jgi:hypothetical protein
VFGDPRICVVGFGSDTIDIYKVSDRMKKMGWNLNELQNPPSFHLCITNCHTDNIITLFIEDLKSCLDKIVTAKFNKNYITTNLEYSELSTIAHDVVSNKELNNNLDLDIKESNVSNVNNVSFDEDNEDEEETGASVYGTTQKVPDQSIVDEVVKCYLNSIH